jgi:putative phage-type endonuclease
MHIANVQPNTQAWLDLRKNYDTASEAPAALGHSKYTSRTDLMKQKATGLTEEIDGYKQRLFDRGHESEAQARPLAEAIIGSDLYPVTATLDFVGLKLLASLDGATMDEEILFEHKLWSESLAADVRSGTLAPHYTIQMDQQLLVSGAKKCLFMVSDGTPEKMAWCWYESTPDKFDALLAGWKQFHADLAEYTPAAKTVAAVAAPVESLPAVSVRLDGQLVVASNLPEFGVALRAFIERIPAKPSTDQEFADCESACKALKKAEDALEASETHALAQMTDVEQMRRAVADLRTLARATRLASEKMVTARKDAIRLEIVANANAALREHIIALNARIGRQYMPAILADFAGVIKGKRSIDSITDAVDTELARAKIAANEVADRIDLNLRHLSDVNAPMFLFADLQAICLKARDDFTALVSLRVSEHAAKEAARLDAERERIRAEEAAKLAKAQADREHQERLNAEFEAQTRAQEAQSSAKNKQLIHEVPYVAPVVEQPAAAPVATVVSMPVRAAAPSTPPTLRLGQISERLGFNVTSAFLISLGFEPAAKDKAAMLYHEATFTHICAALVRHINAVQVSQAA